jgi:hypothetical protein
MYNTILQVSSQSSVLSICAIIFLNFKNEKKKVAVNANSFYLCTQFSLFLLTNIIQCSGFKALQFGYRPTFRKNNSPPSSR